jgi:hypothetical protein
MASAVDQTRAAAEKEFEALMAKTIQDRPFVLDDRTAPGSDSTQKGASGEAEKALPMPLITADYHLVKRFDSVPSFTADGDAKYTGKEKRLWCGAVTNDGSCLGGRVFGVQCFTCWPKDGQHIVCGFCAVSCHKGHELTVPFIIGGHIEMQVYCDCASDAATKKCLENERKCVRSTASTFETVAEARDYFGPLAPFVQPFLALFDGHPIPQLSSPPLISKD